MVEESRVLEGLVFGSSNDHKFALESRDSQIAPDEFCGQYRLALRFQRQLSTAYNIASSEGSFPLTKPTNFCLSNGTAVLA
jgi:hypothetical protein